MNLDRYLWQNPIALGLLVVALVERCGGKMLDA
jgi:hypothetical protein